MIKARYLFFSAVLMSINIIIGSFIFVAPQRMAAMAGSVSFLGWGFAGLLLLPIVLTVAYAARAFPGAGGFYHYCASGINETAGFLAQWSYLLGYLGTASTITVIIRERLASQMGLLFCDQHPYLFYAAFITGLSLLNLLSVQLISKIQSGVTLLKLTPLFLVVLLLPFYVNTTITYHVGELANLGYTLPLAFFGFWGFESCCAIGHMLKGGPAQVSRVALSAFSITVVLYTLFHFGVLNIMGVENLIAQGTSAFPSFLGFSPIVTQNLLIFIVFAIMLSLINTTFGVSLTNIAIVGTLAERRSVIGATFLTRKMRNGTHYNAVIVQALILMALVCFLSNVQVLSSIANFGIAGAFLCVLVAVLRHSFTHAHVGQVCITVLGFASFSILLYFSWLQAGTDTAARVLNLMPILVGIPAGLFMYTYCTRAR